MEILECQHIRIRDTNDYDGCSPEEWIRSLEEEYKLDIRTIPQWKELTKRLHVITTDCKTRIQDAQLRKKYIAQKLFLEYTRFTPFELTDRLSRTAKKWEQIERDLKLKKTRCILQKVPSVSYSSSSEQTEEIHQNTVVAEAETEQDISSGELVPSNLSGTEENSALPPNICTNQHKLICPSASQYSSIGEAHYIDQDEEYEDNASELKQTTSVKWSPSVIRVIYNDLNKQFLPFSVTNRSSDIMFIRFKTLINRGPFKAPRIKPRYQQKMYPGLPLKFVFIFKLRDFRDDFTSQIIFKVGHVFYNNDPDETLCIPVVSDFQKGIRVSVPETVIIPPLYPWHYNKNQTKATFEVSVDDGRNYHLHIEKRIVDHASEPSEENLTSSRVVCPSTKTTEEKSSDTDSSWTAGIADKSNQCTISKSALGFGKSNPSFTKHYMSGIAADIVERALDTFYFKYTYFPFLIDDPKKLKINVFLLKIERTGWHYSYYDFHFYDQRTENIAVTKTMKVFVEILAHPISIEPELILIMTESPHVHGYYQDKFVIRNSHKLYPVIVKICLTSQMKKLFRIIPMRSHIPTTCSVPFEVKFCTTDRIRNAQNYVHFNIKILVFGHKSIYRNVPPIYYEIIAPCEIYYNHLLNRPTMLVDPTELAF